MKSTLTMTLVLAASVSGAAVTGPRVNPDDQFRFFWYLGKSAYPTARDAGINMLINTLHDTRWWMKMESKGEARVKSADMPALIRQMDADGVDYVEKMTMNAAKNVKAKFAQTKPDGSKNLRSIEVGDPAFLAWAEPLWAKAADEMKAWPAVIGVHASSEVRDGSRPSFSPAFAARCKAALGYEMPKEITETRLTLKSLKDFPADGLVEKNYRPLEYLTWFWREGDGWNGYNDKVAEAFRRQFGRDILVLYDPVTRTPPLWGSGGNLTHQDQWFYAEPQPYGISFIVSEEHAMARGTPGRRTLVMIQGITNHDRAAPLKMKIENPPEWKARAKKKRYITQPRDLLREALWMAFARQTDGIGFFAWDALFDHPDSGKGFAYTDPTAFGAAADAFHRVGIPLGPLFKAVPERQPVVAFLESSTSSILASTGSMGWNYNWGDLVVAANLAPYVIYEEEIEKSGIPDTVKVVIAPDCPALLKSTAAALKAFRARGGVLAADASLAKGVDADILLPEGLLSRSDRAKDAVRDTKIMRRAAKELKESIAHVHAPYADSPSADIIVHARTYRNADYVFAINDRRGFGDYIGPWKKIPEKGLPNEGVVTVRRKAGAVYDLERHAKADFTVKNGITTIPVSYTTSDGRIFLVSPRELGPLAISVKGGEVEVRSADADVMIPIEVVADGAKPRYGVVENGVWKRPYKAGAKLRVRNLADGKTYAIGGSIRPVVKAKPAVETPAVLRAGQTTRPFVRKAVTAKPKVEMPYRDNRAWSQSEQNDHATIRVETVPQRGGRFQFSQPVKKHEAVELWFGKRKRDLYVWLNGTYLGQFDASKRSGQEFRLDATKEAKLKGVNKVVVKGADGEVIHTKFTAELLSWGSH